MERFKNEFEKHERLTEFISEMASTGKVPREWSTFISVLNEALSQHDVSDWLDEDSTDCGCEPETCKMLKGKCKNLACR